MQTLPLQPLTLHYRRTQSVVFSHVLLVFTPLGRSQGQAYVRPLAYNAHWWRFDFNAAESALAPGDHNLWVYGQNDPANTDPQQATYLLRDQVRLVAEPETGALAAYDQETRLPPAVLNPVALLGQRLDAVEAALADPSSALDCADLTHCPQWTELSESVQSQGDAISQLQQAPGVRIGQYRYALLEERAPTGVAGGDYTSGGFAQRMLNTVAHQRGPLSLEQGRFLLLPGEYDLRAWALCSDLAATDLLLFNTTLNQAALYGASYAAGGGNTSVRLAGSLVVNTVGGEWFELRHYGQQSVQTYGLGRPGGGQASAQIYSQVEVYLVNAFDELPVAPYTNTLEAALDGVNDSLVGENPLNALTWNQPFSLALDLYRQSGQGLLSLGDMVHTGGKGLLLSRGGLGGAGLTVRLSNGLDYLQVYSGQYANSQRYFVVITYDGSGAPGGLKFYLNGFNALHQPNWEDPAGPAETGAGFSSGDFASGAPLRIGQTSFGALSGRVDQISFWNRALTPAEVASVGLLPDIPAQPNAADCLHWWPVGEGDVFPTVGDRLGANHLGMTGMTPASFVSRA